ncbi:uncharacterized protein EAF01_012046 [Botrytis porri]|uniref:uncharacterized protein n=1 Tax=Botrytis porri TaxID=87229 RepID=UPI0018FFECEA|nr:uncharacterized protein EAF01_012046 [Botrytis porri]KAF7880198.1 hypothetical protein EAF01_012046 [Botrytis porri]
MAYTKDFQDQKIPNIATESSFEGKCVAFRSTLFPPPPITPKPQWEGYKQSQKWEWPSLSQIELRNACSAKIQGKTPGPDGITQEIITKAYKAIPQVNKKTSTLFMDIKGAFDHVSENRLLDI